VVTFELVEVFFIFIAKKIHTSSV